MLAERKTIECVIQFESYIAHPYWPEREQSIQIELRSGVNRLKNDDKKVAALRAECGKRGITLEDYRELKRLAARPWYRIDSADESSPIIIPRHQLAGCLVETIGRSPKALRGKYEKDSFRHHVRISDFTTEKVQADEVFDRYVKLEGSNKRDHQVSPVIRDFEAVGTFSIVHDAKPEELKRVMAFALEEVGVGASRKMGYGRGAIVSFE